MTITKLAIDTANSVEGQSLVLLIDVDFTEHCWDKDIIVEFIPD